ncbi:hypothetical protein N7474_006799 [Penicillium riverlandense]|uniref:uncharacterized protein n=1 Tax=Penicillium riverlandense TaxID=1903569 RepID=UPI0025468984|nr:uncharacterized protein N7474_006799 [Penicillium riverlandense]KAJ5815022.1 hypothetical protein N7474_006799 [Penicillium riverlandense]
MTLRTIPIPPSPPRSTDGDPSPGEIYQRSGPYPPVYNTVDPIKMQGDEINPGFVPQSSTLYASPSPYFQPALQYPPMPLHAQMVVPGPHTNTPPPTSDEELVPCPVGTPPPKSSPARRRAPTPKAKLSRSPKARRARERREADTPETSVDSSSSKELYIPLPLSELTKHMTDVPVKDIEGFVNRSFEERWEEVKQKGRITRPMNSFMLYRSAYTDRIKRYLNQTNNQAVSRACGLGWKLEPKYIREKYERYACIERDEHARAHPDYKFSPSKDCKAPPARKRQSADEAINTPSSTCDPATPSDWDDVDYHSNPGSSFLLHNRLQSFDVNRVRNISRTSTPFDAEPVPLPSSWSMSYPGRMETPHGLPTAVHPSALQMNLHYSRPSPPPQDAQYGSSSSTLAALPGATHHELLQPQPMYPAATRLTEERHMDPQLLSYESGPPPAESGVAFSAPPSYPVWNDDAAANSYLTTSASSVPPSPATYYPTHITAVYHHHQGVHMIDARDPSWDMHNHHEASSAEFEPWFEQQSGY